MEAHEGARRPGVVEVDVGEQQVAHVRELERLRREPGLEGGQRRGGTAVEEREAVVGLDQVDADRMLAPAEPEVEEVRRGHPGIFAQPLRAAPGASSFGARREP